MLFALHIEVGHKLVGMAPAAFFEYTTGVSHMTYRRGRGYEAFFARREKTIAGSDSLLLRMLQKRGLPDASFRGFKESLPQGHSTMMFHGLGLLDEHSAPATRDLLKKLDASEKRIFLLAKTDLSGFAAEIGPASELGLDYCAPLAVAGFRRPALDFTETEWVAVNFALNRRAQMALSFLAAMDHEIGHRIGRTRLPDSLSGLPGFAMLLAPPGPRGRRRHAPADPAARLVDFVGAVGHLDRTGGWPERPLTTAAMGAQAELSGTRQGEGDRFIRGLRSGKDPLSRLKFRTLVHTQFWTPTAKPTDLDDLADGLEVYLVAALLLSLLIPDDPTAPGHLDRTGWRGAYLAWWERHKHRYPPPAAPAGPPPPSWLIDPGAADPRHA